ncbi:hypothetical protein PMZ80_001276 [Knufia obscura]|uniref:Uncharacterized protein n=1 Tax=Knufia obscura TaxID=1635080 RepID=A0ABR0S2N7_9EURO|nr:hypothetical protein PMZ80_001276 [Knufia obscura]
MASLLPRRAPYVCKACQTAQTSRAVLRAFATSTKRSASLREQLQEREAGKTKHSVRPTQRIEDEASRTFQKAQQATSEPTPVEQDGTSAPTQTIQASSSAQDVPNPQQALRDIQVEALSLLESEAIPDEAVVLGLLERARTLANVLVNTQQTEPQVPQQGTATPTKQTHKSDLFDDLSETLASQSRSPASTATTQTTPSTTTSTLPHSAHPSQSLSLPLAKTLYTLLEDPKLYISESILTHYVHTLTLLSLPQYLPKIFHLYAHKPIPKPGTSPITYNAPWSTAPKYAVSMDLVNMAMDSAIKARDMPLAISIIDTTVATPQFRRAKFIRKALLPLTAVGSVIPLSYSLSTRAAAWQLTWEPDVFFWMCIAGSSAYLGTMGALLFVTVTTWNDHHKRVRWVPGTPLGRRWAKEEERMLFDRVAGAWGFREVERHGEEGGGVGGFEGGVGGTVVGVGSE